MVKTYLIGLLESKRMRYGLAAAFVVCLVAGSALIFFQNSPADKTIRIGSILILSGEGSAWGIAEKNGIDMAVEKINFEGGINGKTLVVSHQDDRGDPKTTLSAFESLVDGSGIKIIIGTTWSRTGLPLVDLADQKKVLMISPSLGVKEFNEKSKYLFNTWPHDFLLSRQLAEYVYAKGYRNVAIIGAQEVWVKDQTNNFKDRFEELGGSVAVLVEPDPANKDIYTEALQIKNSGADAMVSTTDGVLVGALIAKRAREIGVSLPVYSITIDASTIEAAQGAYEGMEFLTSLTPSPEFKAEYEKRYRIPIDIGADSAYDGVMLVARAMRATNSTDTEVLQAYLNSVSEYSGVSGHLVSDGRGGFAKGFVVEKVVNGTAVVIG